MSTVLAECVQKENMEDAFRRVVEHIFNNWTALKLSVEHNLTGSEGTKVAVEFMNYMVQYCIHGSAVNIDGIQEALDDIMDQEFETICEDGSTKEIAILLYKFLELLKENNTTEFENEYKKLPVNTGWLVSTLLDNGNQKKCVINNQELHDDDKQTEIPMEQDSEWTEVKSRRKK